ncbi:MULTISPECIES: hypothetical protein [Pseudomonas]|uniref:hypothetical protein n=1 Tax=Pseudomonas TaxID=286 RepID=UPI001BF15E89|nr:MULTISPECIES: hypothetical protein [Pseudomonas]UXY52136.1 hypothetical protein N9L84_24735 [Pseudomonas tohonis]BBP85399.1 hypothetical protein PHLH8_50410 [Pseudomonas sp. Pc102]
MMMLLWSLFAPRAKIRCFALLDDKGACRGFHQSAEAPARGNWVEVREPRLSWIGQPLPTAAPLKRVVRQARGARALAA